MDSFKPEHAALPIFENIPQELRSYRQWVAWRSGQAKDGKLTKIPVNPHTGRNASTNKPDTWGSYEDALAYYEEHKGNSVAGIGFVFTKDDPYCGVDLDDCIDPGTGEIKDWAQDILAELDSYSEVSPSNTGVKAFCKGTLPGPGRNAGSIEMYDTGRYFTLTGKQLENTPASAEDRNTQVQALYQRLSGSKTKPAVEAKKTDPSLCDVDVDSLPVPYGTKKLIREGEERGKRSEAFMSVLDSLVAAGIPEADIVTILENFPIGEKYREKGATKERWLKKRIEKARTFTKKGAPDNSETSLAFPHHVMSGAAGYFVDVYGGKLETPREFLYMSYLTCLGAVLAKRLTLATEIAPQPRLYTLLLGESADERKSTAIKKTVDHFRDTLPSFDVCWGVGSAEGLQKKMEGVTAGLLLCFDEFKQFVSKCKIDSSVLLPCVNTLFESNRYESRTKTTNIELAEANLSILAASTVETHRRTWDGSFTDIGFTNRLFLVPGTSGRKFSFPEKISDSEKETMKDQLRKIIDHVGESRELGLSAEAGALYHRWYMNSDRSIHAKRLDVYALRLMALVAVIDLKSEVDEETVEKVIDICDWQLEVRKLYDPIDADNKVARMEESIRRQLQRRPMKESDLKRAVNANRAGLWVFETARKNLVGAEEVCSDQKKKTWVLL